MYPSAVCYSSPSFVNETGIKYTFSNSFDPGLTVSFGLTGSWTFSFISWYNFQSFISLNIFTLSFPPLLLPQEECWRHFLSENISTSWFPYLLQYLHEAPTLSYSFQFSLVSYCFCQFHIFIFLRNTFPNFLNIFLVFLDGRLFMPNGTYLTRRLIIIQCKYISLKRNFVVRYS